MERDIAQRVKEAREAKGLTKVELAAAIGLTKQGYSPYEVHGRFTIPQLFAISRMLGKPVVYFLGLETGLSGDEQELLFRFRLIRDAHLRALAIQAVKLAAEVQGKRDTSERDRGAP